jgi:hypothetical protein
MNSLTYVFRFITFALLVSMIVSGCSAIRITRAGEMKTKTHSVDLGAATSARVQVVMDLGELKIDGADGKLMEGTFNYNVANWQPQVSYEVDGSQGSLIVSQPGKDTKLVNQGGQNRWELHLSNSVPIDLEISTGAGISELNLSNLNLNSLMIETGAGNSTVDLGGRWEHDLTVTIRSGIGNMTMYLPREIGVRVDVKTGIGSVETAGLSKDGDEYINDTFGKTPNTLHLEIEAGIGTIDLQIR